MRTTAAPTIYINDRPEELAAESSLADVVRRLGLQGRKGVAVAVNGAVVPRGEWDARKLAGEDRVLVIQATQGG